MLSYIKKLYFKIKKKEVYVDGQCHQCGHCCRSLCLITSDRKIIKTEKQFIDYCKSNKDFERFEIIDKRDDCLIFKCKLLKDNKCSDYENRLPLCKTYPSRELFFSGFNTNPSCGYTIRTGKSFEHFLKKHKVKK
jgi:hypothetical protein